MKGKIEDLKKQNTAMSKKMSEGCARCREVNRKRTKTEVVRETEGRYMPSAPIPCIVPLQEVEMIARMEMEKEVRGEVEDHSEIRLDGCVNAISREAFVAMEDKKLQLWLKKPNSEVKTFHLYDMRTKIRMENEYVDSLEDE